jgi:peptide/nickel transport system substrate-binding protein
MSLTLDGKAFIDIITEEQGDIGGTMLPQPEGIWSMPPELPRTLPGYDPDVANNRAQARDIMQNLVMGRTNDSRSRYRHATFRATAMRQ